MVRRPDTGEILPPAGAVVPWGPHRAYWLRRRKDGDVSITHTAVPVRPADDREEG
ncbi:hypothetical protein DESPIGER_0175 [Desulfovibrio piger]|uniref:DUF2635 domain-containing protein n=1 Tax=Desulfovibrio piger TaxID=901 RepID=A0A1K1LBJ5_9BACT|nr:hypothetical protein DESPIGER_0175 [Desulfovibrio piger]